MAPGTIASMARTSKTPRFDEFNVAPNAFGHRAQDPQKWRTVLDPEIPLNLELGCGKAEVSLALAAKYPDENFIGVDLKADRLWRASKQAIEAELDNVAFVQINILSIEEFINKDTVKMIWITHPDPFPKDRQAKHRMLNRNFLDIYKKVLQPGAPVRLKTDNLAMFEWAMEYLGEQKDLRINDSTNDLHGDKTDEDLLVETTFTKKYLARDTKINYLEFSFTG